MKYLISTLLISICTFTASGQWLRQNVDTKASLRGLSVVSEKVVWASGTGGTVIKTADGGSTWKVMTVPGAEKLDFRDIEAFDANTAYILSIGNGDTSRIYKTVNGGVTWENQFTNRNEKAFFDAIACVDPTNCIAVSDPVNGSFSFISTGNGEQWQQGGPDFPSPPVSKEGEAAFAASGTCLIWEKGSVYLVSGGAVARVFRTAYNLDMSRGWTVSDTPFASGAAGTGIFSIAVFDCKHGVIVGGNYEKPNEAISNLAFTTDCGETWTSKTGLSGYRSAVAYVDKKTIIAVGTNGTDISRDGGKKWKKTGDENLNAVAAKGRRAVWAVGPNGLVAKMK